MEAERLEPVELEYDGEEAVRERLRVPAPAGECIGASEMRRRVHDDAGAGGSLTRSGPRGGPHDAPHHVCDMHQQHDQRDDNQCEADVEADGVAIGEMIEPFNQVVPLPGEPGHEPAALDPLVFRTREYLADHAAQRVGWDSRWSARCLEQGEPGADQRIPICSLRTCRSNASRRTRKS